MSEEALSISPDDNLERGFIDEINEYLEAPEHEKLTRSYRDFRMLAWRLSRAIDRARESKRNDQISMLEHQQDKLWAGVEDDVIDYLSTNKNQSKEDFIKKREEARQHLGQN